MRPSQAGWPPAKLHLLRGPTGPPPYT